MTLNPDLLTRPIATPNDRPPDDINLAAPGWHVMATADGDLALDDVGYAQLVFIPADEAAPELAQ